VIGGGRYRYLADLITCIVDGYPQSRLADLLPRGVCRCT
jgi:hypothetical protein